MKQFFFILMLVPAYACIADEDIDEEYIQYSKTIDLYYEVMELTFDCETETGDVDFRYTEDYRRSNLEHYFAINYRRLCFVEAIGKSIHDQVFNAVKNGLEDAEIIFKSIKSKKTIIKTVDCKEIETSYWSFFKELKDSISSVENGYREATLPKDESTEGEKIRIMLHPPVFDFTYGDYFQPKHSIHVAGNESKLVKWAYETIEKLDACGNH